MKMPSNNSSLNESTRPSEGTNQTYPPRDGYDIPIFGLDNGKFVSVHITALTCIGVSIIFTICVLIMSFRSSSKTFFRKSKSERLIVYMAVCDGLFNLAHSLDHLHIFITKDHVRPKELCTIYAFMIGEFVSSQMLMVNIVAINVFSMIFLQTDISFGKKDWRLLTYAFGVPFVVYLVSAILGKLGPTGSFCHFDAIKGADMFVYYLTVLICVVIFVNSTLYIATWIRIYKDSKELSYVLGNVSQSKKKAHNSARTMSLFILVFFIQWFALVAFSISGLLGHIPDVILYLTVSLNNIGGVLNGIVFIMIRRRKNKRNARQSTIYNNSQILSTISQ